MNVRIGAPAALFVPLVSYFYTGQVGPTPDVCNAICCVLNEIFGCGQLQQLGPQPWLGVAVESSLAENFPSESMRPDPERVVASQTAAFIRVKLTWSKTHFRGHNASAHDCCEIMGTKTQLEGGQIRRHSYIDKT